MIDNQIVTPKTLTLAIIKKRAGFSLLEIMVVLVILAVFALLAYPSYQGYIKKTNRVAAMAELHKIASRIEAKKLTVNRYENILIADVFDHPIYANNALTDNEQTVGDLQQTNQVSHSQNLGVYMLYPAGNKALYRITITPLSQDGKFIGNHNWQLVATPTENGLMATDGGLILTQQAIKCHKHQEQDNATCGKQNEWQHSE